jgi:hypothetical protein
MYQSRNLFPENFIEFLPQYKDDLIQYLHYDNKNNNILLNHGICDYIRVIKRSNLNSVSILKFDKNIKPQGIASQPHTNNILVCTKHNHQNYIQVLSDHYIPLYKITKNKQNNERSFCPKRVCCGVDGHVFTSCAYNYQLQHFDNNGRWIKNFPIAGFEALCSMNQGGTTNIIISHNGFAFEESKQSNEFYGFDVYCPSNNQKILSKQTHFMITDVNIDLNGYVYILGDGNNIHILDPRKDFKHVQKIDHMNFGDIFNSPRALCFDDKNTMIVGDHPSGYDDNDDDDGNNFLFKQRIQCFM